MKGKLTATILLLITFCSYGQVEERKDYFPIWTYHQSGITIHGISLGLWSSLNAPKYTNTNGIKIELIGLGVLVPLIPRSPVAENDSTFLKLTKEPISEIINGLSISASGAVCDCITNGISTGLIGQINFQVNGISSSIFMNFAQRHNGIQIAFFNESYYMRGLQLGISNYGVKSKGLQIGIGNSGTETRGLQLGLFNKSKKLKGVQIGLWNVSQNRKLPIINWNFKNGLKE